MSFSDFDDAIKINGRFQKCLDQLHSQISYMHRVISAAEDMLSLMPIPTDWFSRINALDESGWCLGVERIDGRLKVVRQRMSQDGELRVGESVPIEALPIEMQRAAIELVPSLLVECIKQIEAYAYLVEKTSQAAHGTIELNGPYDKLYFRKSALTEPSGLLD